MFEEPVEGDAEDLVGLACSAGLRVFGDGGEVVGVAIAVGDVEGLEAEGVGDSHGQDVDRSCSGWLEGDGALEQSSEPQVGFDGDDAALGAGFLRGADGEEADVGADVPDGVAGVDELAGEIEEVGVEAGIPVLEAGVGRDVDGCGVEIAGKVAEQDAVAAYFFGKGPERSHGGCIAMIAS